MVYRVLMVTCLAGCYEPTIKSCQYDCNGKACPSGLACSKFKKCVDDDWTAHLSNVDVCSNDLLGHTSVTTPWIFNHSATIDSGAPDAPFRRVITLADNRQAQLVVVGDLTITGVDTLITVTPAFPLIVLVNGSARIEAKVELAPGMFACTTGAGGNAEPDFHGGGGGGAFGNKGADGGFGAGVATGYGQAGMFEGTAELVPLRGGCSGGTGNADATDAGPGAGGLGGNAIQISVRDTFQFSGVISAPGAGGSNPPFGSINGGAGGGGSGGAILLEGETLEFTAGRLCANGGGGGAGKPDPMMAEAGRCETVDTPAAGANGGQDPSTSTIIRGGHGATGKITAERGFQGDNFNTDGRGGGGGGGGVGRIRINGAGAINTVTSPQATTGTF